MKTIEKRKERKKFRKIKKYIQERKKKKKEIQVKKEFN